METINTYYDDYASLEEFVKNNNNLLAVNNRAVLAQIFSGICDENHILTISKQIRGLIPHAQVIGSTTSGEIMNGLVSGLKTVLSFSVFRQSKIKTAFLAKSDEDDYGMGQSIATKLNSDKAKVLILFATGLTISGSQILKGIQSVNADLPVAGGIAGSNRTNKQSFVCCNHNITDCGVVGAVLEGTNLTVTRHTHLGWVPIGKEMTITKADGARVYTIDNIPAYQVYYRYLGIKTDSDIFKVVEFPLMICRHGLTMARAPFMRYADDSICFFGDIAEGENVRFGFGHVELILEKVDYLRQMIEKQPVESIFVYSCASRRGFFQESAQIETLPLQNIAPTSGFFTSGEFYHINGSNQLLNTTMTTLALSESSPQMILARQTKTTASLKESGKKSEAIKDNIADRNIEILKALTYLVNTVTNELNEKTAELQLVNEQLQYASSHDALTSLNNRGFLREEIKRLGGKPAGVIICDVNGLKFVNDSFGHLTGDALIQAAANILKSVFGPEDVVARIGGDEFAVLIPNASRSIIEESCLKIHKAVVECNRENLPVPLSLSIGFAFAENDAADIRTLIKEADRRMYREKISHRQGFSNNLVHILMKDLEERNLISKGHNNHLQELYFKVASDSEFTINNLAEFLILIRFYDIGKVGISDQILLKPGPLNQDEEKEMQRHCEIGYRIAQSTTELRPIADWILRHHEWWNGQGYPLGIKGIDIPLECRILAIIDAYDEMTADRPYRKAMSPEAAIAEIRRCAGTQFDPVLAERFIREMEKSSGKSTKT